MQGLDAIARNLLNLEVNTILCDGISAEKMPDAAHALLDVAQRYHRFLLNRIGDLRQEGIDVRPGLPPLAANGATVDFEAWQPRSANLAVFEALRAAAQCCVAALHRNPPHGWEQRQVIFDRISVNAEQIKAIYRNLGEQDVTSGVTAIDIGASLDHALDPGARLSQSEVVLLRKIWEVGTEMIAMQTVVLIDGDVFTRVQAGWQSDADQALHTLHRQAVETCVTQWTNLFRIAAELLGSVFQPFFRESPPSPDSVPRSA
ncbi:MAG TPA: hypothetical protein VH855_30140 [Acetobacteraceae bacterium]